MLSGFLQYGVEREREGWSKRQRREDFEDRYMLTVYLNNFVQIVHFLLLKEFSLSHLIVLFNSSNAVSYPKIKMNCDIL